MTLQNFFEQVSKRTEPIYRKMQSTHNKISLFLAFPVNFALISSLFLNILPLIIALTFILGISVSFVYLFIHGTNYLSFKKNKFSSAGDELKMFDHLKISLTKAEYDTLSELELTQTQYETIRDTFKENKYLTAFDLHRTIKASLTEEQEIVLAKIRNRLEPKEEKKLFNNKLFSH